MAEIQDRLLDHEYDGIRELDNDLPRWWLWLFYASIIFAVLYMLYFHVLEFGYSSAQEYIRENDPNFVPERGGGPKYFGIIPRYRSPLAANEDEEMSQTGATEQPLLFFSRDTDTTTYVALTDGADIAVGNVIFLKSCASCHGPLGEGGIGPNLTDDYWIHGADFSTVVRSVRYGYPTKGMIAWLGTLQPEQILQAASYVTTLRGTNPPNPKAPEGELISN